MSQKNASVGDVLTQLREYELKIESHFVANKAKLEAVYAKKNADLKESTSEFEKKQKTQYELKLKDVNLLAKKSAMAQVTTLNKTYSAQLTNAATNLSKAKEIVLKNLV